MNIAGDCEETVVKRAVNQSKKIHAVRIRIDCGATTTPSSTIRIVESIDTADNGEVENTILSNGAGTDFYWLGNDTLLVKGLDTINKDVRKTEFHLSKVEGKVTIVYQY